MSTRCQIGFYEEKPEVVDAQATGAEAVIYQHSDGYPGSVDGNESGVLSELIPYLRSFIKDRGWDVSYMAARTLAHLINVYDQYLIKAGYDEFQFTGFGIDNLRDHPIHGDIEYYYVVRPGGVDVYEVGFDSNGPEDFKLIQTVDLAESMASSP
jgi:hypothetical protein